MVDETGEKPFGTCMTVLGNSRRFRRCTWREIESRFKCFVALTEGLLTDMSQSANFAERTRNVSLTTCDEDASPKSLHSH